MNKKFKICEMPRRIYPVDPDLGFTVEKNNRDLASEIIKSKNTIQLESTKLGNILYKYGNKFVLVDPYRMMVLYYLSWKDKYYKYLNSTVSQEVLHWRDRGLYETIDLSSHVFFDLLLPIHGKIMTDFIHTNSGERFWLRRINETFNKNLHIYCIYFLQTTDSSRKIVKVKDDLSFKSLLISPDNKLSNNPWGYDNKFEARRILITQEPLDVKIENN
jgi:hypothetical protein